MEDKHYCNVPNEATPSGEATCEECGARWRVASAEEKKMLKMSTMTVVWRKVS